MKAKGYVWISLLIVAYYLVFVGLVGIKIFPSTWYDINYYVPYDSNYQPLVHGATSFFFIALGAVIFAVSYMELENHYNFKIKIMNKHHCEKIMVLYVCSIIAIVYFALLMYEGTWIYPMDWFYLAVMTWVGGLLGIIYYKKMNRKPINLKTVILFWKNN